MKKTIHLGYEVPGGDPVGIPIRHMVVCGLTQQSGKTTTLEALLSRSGRRAIVFSTKRGEREFEGTNPVTPFYREQVDWQYVQSLLEATMNERLKFERSWIITVTRGARTLEQVHQNIRDQLSKKQRGISESVYTNLDAYFELVLPEIRRANFSPKLELSTGVNRMMLDHLRPEVQSLVLRSVIDEIYQKYRETIVVIPEAWKFLPEKRGNPCKFSVERLVREGAALGNHVWLDSQDITGINKAILKSCDVWLLGRQREINEIKRMIEQIPVLPKPTKEQIAGLGVGNFVACFDHKVQHVYVQPSWVKDYTARDVAIGKLAPDASARKVRKREEEDMSRIAELDKSMEILKLRQENESLQNEIVWKDKRLLELEDPTKSAPSMSRIAALERENEGLHGENRSLQESISRLQKRLAELESKTRSSPVAAAPGPEAVSESVAKRLNLSQGSGDAPVDSIVQLVLDRVRNDPTLLEVLADEREIVINVERKTIQADQNTTRGRIAMLIHDGFFDAGATANAARTELKRRGVSIGTQTTYDECDRLAAWGFLTKEKGEGYRAVPEMRKNIVKRSAA